MTDETPGSSPKTGIEKSLEAYLLKWRVIFGVGSLIFFIGLGIWVYQGTHFKSGNLQVGTAAATATFLAVWLALVAGLYAKRQAHIIQEELSTAQEGLQVAQKQLLETIASNRSAISPIITFTADDREGRLTVRYSNVGRGPALRIQCWIEQNEAQHLMAVANRRNNAALGADRDAEARWSPGDNVPDLRMGLDIVMQYEGVTRMLFESRLQFVANGPELLLYGPAKSDERKY
ncbi:MAG: hypothetical protein HY681_08460 [Chloroflexi bacterium]|nr:hypothetical protein [Chloroflexota bacterium]